MSLDTTIEIYNKIAKVYTAKFFNDKSNIKYVDIFTRLLNHKNRILDAGCGPGNYTKYFCERNFIVEGIDLSDNMLNIARDKVNYKNANFSKMDIRNIEFPDKYFDGIFASYSLIHIPKYDIPRILYDFFRLLKPNGVLFLAFYNGISEELYITEPLKPNEFIFLNKVSVFEIIRLLKHGCDKISYFEQDTNKEGEFTNKKIYFISHRMA